MPLKQLILVHGIKQEGKTADGLTVEWLKGLRALATDAGWPKPVEVTMPFFGDVLFNMTEEGAKSARNLVAQGNGQEIEELNVSSDYAEEAADKAGLTIAQIDQAEAEILAEEGGAAELVVPQGSIVHNRRTKAILRLIEKISPFHGDIALRILGQAHAYLKRDDVAEAVDDIVRPFLDTPEEKVVIAHSLGTIVTYKILRDLGAAANVKLYMTLGSPLGLASVKKELSPDLSFPKGVKRWINGGDPDDFVAMRTELKGIFKGDIIDLGGIKNGDEDKHAIVDYLSNKTVYEPIMDAMK